MPVDSHGCTHDHGNFRSFFLHSWQNERGVLCAAFLSFIFAGDNHVNHRDSWRYSDGVQDNCRSLEKGDAAFVLSRLLCVASRSSVQMLRKKPNVVPIQHNVKVVVAGAQMTTDSVAKEE